MRIYALLNQKRSIYCNFTDREEIMAPIDFVCIGIMLLFGVIGFFRGFAKQLRMLLGWFVALIVAVLLVPPIYKVLFTGGGALENVCVSLEGLFSFVSVPNLEKAAVKYNLSGSGAFFARWTVMLVILLLLWIIVTIIFKLIRIPLRSYIEAPVAGIDKALGVMFGIFIGFMLTVLILAVLYCFKYRLPAVGELLEKIVPENSLTNETIYALATKIGDYFKAVRRVYVTTVPNA